MMQWTYKVKENVIDGQTVYYIFAYCGKQVKLYEDSFPSHNFAYHYMKMLEPFDANGHDFNLISDDSDYKFNNITIENQLENLWK